MRRWLLAVTVLALVVGVVSVSRGSVPCDVLRTQPTCYVALRPGPAEDTLQLVDVEGASTYTSSGELLLTTVAVDDDLGWFEWIGATTSGTAEAVPRETVYPPGSDRDDVTEQNAALMADSQLTATLVALGEAGYDVAGDGALVVGVAEDAVTDELEAGDVVVAIDGETVTDSTGLVDAVAERSPGDRVELTVRGDAGQRRVPVTLGEAPDEADRAYVGVFLTTDVDLPVDVSIDAGVIGGPSAGLMFALTIVDLLGPDDLTGGAVVAGTGTVDRDGTVRPIGGIRQKLLGATSRSGEGRPATVFLVPRGNLDEARDTPVDREVLVVPVDTLEEALAALEDLRDGREPVDALALPLR